MENPILLLKNKVSNLSDSQRKVADYILKNPLDVAFLTVDQLAGLVGTSTTTIMRLTFNLGYSGYTEFQKGLQEILRNRADPNTRFETKLKESDHSDLWIQCAENQINNIESTIAMISKDYLEKTVELILSSRQVYCTAIRSAVPVAQSLTYGLSRILGKAELIIADHGNWTEKVINFTPSDLVIAISFPRYANNVIELIKTAKQNGARVISITDSYSSPLVKYSDFILPCNVSSASFHNSILAPMLIVDYLISVIPIKEPELTKDRLDKIDTILSSMNYHYLNESYNKKTRS
jgi:DNA-binding MurR/RpiR family transcriptional regulator